MLNGRFPGDEVGNYTCTANMGRSIAGYFIVSTDLFDRVVDFFVVIADFSDYFPLVCSLSIESGLLNVSDSKSEEIRMTESYKWKESYGDTSRSNSRNCFKTSSLLSMT